MTKEDERAQSNAKTVILPNVTTAFVSYTEFVSMQRHGLSDDINRKYYKNYIIDFMKERVSQFVNKNSESIWFKDAFAFEERFL